MSDIVYIVRVILIEGKNKTIVEEKYTGVSYYHDDNNNLIIMDKDNKVVIDIHNYNYVSIRSE